MSRVNLSKMHPAVYQQVVALSNAADEAAEAAGLCPQLLELIKIRVAQINGCAFCLRLHTRDAVKLGVSSDRIAVLAAWWESQYFAEAEQAALILAEAVTQLTVPELTISADVLSDEQISAVNWVALVANAWNRVAIRSGYTVGP